ncbi:carbohydrate-binding family 9-like protein [Flavobacteriaceae sp. LMIT009]
MRTLLAFILGLLIISCSKKTEEVITIDVSNDIVIPKHYVVSKTSEAIIIDGEASEESWNNATFTDKFIDIEGVKTPKYDTQLKMLWDDTFLYVYTEMREPHIWGTLKQRDTVIFYNNDFEIFLDPSGTTHGYGEIEINALNTVWDLYLDKPYRVGGKANFEWNLDNLKTAVQIHGTLNNSSDIDSHWTIEMAIPLKPLISLKNNPKTLPKEGEQWRINFSRVQWDHDLTNGKYSRKKENNKFSPEYNWVWSNQKVINMHEPEKWGFLQFTENSSSENVKFIEDKEIEIKQVAYALFRHTKYGDLKYLLDETEGAFKAIEVTYAENETISSKFNKTSFGFEIIITSPITNHKFIINEEGRLKQI